VVASALKNGLLLLEDGEREHEHGHQSSPEAVYGPSHQ